MLALVRRKQYLLTLDFAQGGETAQHKMDTGSIPRYSKAPVGAQIHSIYKSRLGQFTSHGQYESANLMG